MTIQRSHDVSKQGDRRHGLSGLSNTCIKVHHGARLSSFSPEPFTLLWIASHWSLVGDPRSGNGDDTPWVDQSRRLLSRSSTVPDLMRVGIQGPYRLDLYSLGCGCSCSEVFGIYFRLLEDVMLGSCWNFITICAEADLANDTLGDARSEADAERKKATANCSIWLIRCR